MEGSKTTSPFFAAAFEALEKAHRSPLRWQTRLYHRLVRGGGNIPGSCCLPTGLGKTSVIPIWLIAMAAAARTGPQCDAPPVRLPRRLVYIVNRRTVVDQATEDAERYLKLLEPNNDDGRLESLEKLWRGGASDRSDGPPNLQQHVQPLAWLRRSLAVLAGSGSDAKTPPLAVSTLRGELADNGEWKNNPARPAIIIGTIDMIGSKLLFFGYGDGRYGRAHHAGLIGQDTLIVHDEAHLSPAFSALLRSVKEEQVRCDESKPIRVMELSATTRANASENETSEQRFGVENEDLEDDVVQDRLNAAKRLAFKNAEKGKLVETVVGEAMRMGENPRRVLVYVRSPKTAGDIVGAIKKQLGSDADDRVGLLTGTIRGFERDKLAQSPLFKEFRSNSSRTPLQHSLYLVSTSAGEVGADLDADDLVCDLTTLDSMAQRFGRVNRLGGEARSAEIMVVREKAAEPDEKKDKKEKKRGVLDAAIAATGEILGDVVKSGGDVSPGSLGKVLASTDAKAAFSPPPLILPATDILFDAWSLTSIMGDMPGRPEVEPYLHGVADWEPPETHVAWRIEISELAKAEVGNDDLEEMMEAFPLRAAEQLKETTARAMEQFAVIAKRHPESRAILMKNGEPRWIDLSELAPDKNDKAKVNEARWLLSYATVILPAEVGGLNQHGMLDGDADAARHLDVAEEKTVGQRDRQRVRVTDEVEVGLMIPEIDPSFGKRCSLKVGFSEAEDEESSRPTIEYRVAKTESGEPGEPVTLADHSAAVEAAAQAMGSAITLPPEVADALSLAGRWHDRGKERPVWQKYAKNYGYGRVQNSALALAKSRRYGDARTDLNGYRHEFGSLMDATASEEIKNHPERELILHLIASHHGWARPYFKHDGRPEGASAFDFQGTVFDPSTGKRRPRSIQDNQTAAANAMRRYALLQRRFGRWGIAWLESLLRAADVTASEGGGK